MLRDKAEGSAGYFKYHLLQNITKIIGKFNISLPNQVLSQVFSQFSLLIKFWSSVDVQTKLICHLPKPFNWHPLTHSRLLYPEHLVIASISYRCTIYSLCY